MNASKVEDATILTNLKFTCNRCRLGGLDCQNAGSAGRCRKARFHPSVMTRVADSRRACCPSRIPFPDGPVGPASGASKFRV